MLAFTSLFSISVITSMSFFWPSFASVDADAGHSFDGDGEDPFFPSSSIFLSSKFKEWNGDMGEVGVSSLGFGLCEEEGDGDKFRDREGIGEPLEAGETGDAARGEFESKVLFCSLSATFCPSSLCVPFKRGGGDGLDNDGGPVNKVLCRVSSCCRSLIFMVFLARKIFFFSSATTTSIFTCRGTRRD